MEQKDKELLLKDLCARLPYGVKLQLYNGELDNDVLNSIDTEEYIIVNGKDDIENIKPYLFPLSSMTEEQREEFLNIQTEERQILLNALIEYKSGKYDKIPIIAPYKQIEWLNKNHFDYRGLIEKGLAIDCTGLNIY